MRIWEFFRRTSETYIVFKMNIDGNGENLLNFDIPFLVHMFSQFIINSNFNILIIAIGDIYIDHHHIMEDIGITFGIVFKNCLLNKINLFRYAYSYVPMDESLSRVVVDLCGRSYLVYDINYNNLFLEEIDVSLFYDFFKSFTSNGFLTLHISNLYGYNPHHKIESVFKSLGISLRIATSFKNKNIKNSSKGFLF